ncbi:MAG: helix-turn-helix domain-containing protein [Pseudomonadota bacterium]
MNLSQIGQTVHEARKQRGITQLKLAELAHVSRYTLIKLENGTAGDIQFKTLAAILAALRMEVTVIDRPVSGLRVLGDK